MPFKEKMFRQIVFALFLWAVLGAKSGSAITPLGQISGQVYDESTQEGLAFASLLISSLPDSTISFGAITDINGSFVLKDIPQGKYKIHATYMGYENQEITAEISSNNTKLKIALKKKSFLISEVEITAEKEIISSGIEKTTLNVAQNSTLAGGNAIDLMQSLPSIDIDVNGNIQYRGSNKVTILLNGKKSELVKSLDQIPTGQIDRLEIINNPSAKFEADGMSGIINIVLKSGNKTSKKTTLSLHAGIPENFGANIGYSGFSEKSGFFVNGGYDHKIRFQTKEHIRKNFDAPNTHDYYQYDRQDETLNNLLLNTGFNYSISKKQQIGISVIGSKKFNSAEREINYQTQGDNSEIIYNSLKDIELSLDNYSIDGDVNYMIYFNEKGQKLEADAHYNHFHQVQEMNQIFYPEQNERDKELQNTEAEQQNKIATFSLDYIHPLGDSLRIETGYRYSNKDLFNDFSSESLQDNIWEQDSALANTFHYLQNINAAYINIEGKLRPFDFQLGLRGEYTSNNQLGKQKKAYFDLFPSVHLSKQLSKNFKAYLTYNIRINRPKINMLNPYTNEYADILNMHIGNPDLKPEYVHSIETGMHYSFQKASGMFSIYYRDIDQAISRVKFATNDSALLVTFMNLDHAQLLGSEFSISTNPFQWWTIHANANVFYTHLKGEYGPNNIDRSHTAWTGSISQKWKLPEKFSIQLSCYYRSPLPDVMGTYTSRYYADLAVNKQILNNKGKIIFKISDVFNTYKYGLDLEGTDENGYQYSQSNRRKNESQYFILSFVYNLQGKEQKKAKGNYYLESFGK